MPYETWGESVFCDFCTALLSPRRKHARAFEPLRTWTCPSKDGQRLNIFSLRDRIWYGSCSLHKLSTLKLRQKCVEECNLHGALLWPLGAEKMRDIKGAGLCPYWQVSLCG
ncbi:hypothetical protein Q7C36_015786 [Tachysurus vachellii]|uniref:Uncharacterized protein n=1 Tax=Tachysurus vachellii TaxID=175792 RepID=A0AA88SFX7_TACVA|nr:hypothetical protein Q7C36_015786 [Tachysurus vachellii]